MKYRLLLASGSARRRELLERIGKSFEVVEPRGVVESGVTGTGAERCRELGRRKAEWVLRERGDEGAGLLVIGSDTLVTLGEGADQEIMGKPEDDDDARRILARLSGRTHRVLTGVAVARPGKGTVAAVESSEVRFRDLTRERIDRYVSTGDAAGKAGAYGIQSGGHQLVDGFRGCYYNIVGLPLTLLLRLLPPDAGVEWTCDCDRHPLWRGGPPCGSSLDG